jgi:hypothetical protein
MVARTWITPGCVQFLENGKRFHTAWVIRVGLACPQHVRLPGDLGSSGPAILPVEGIGLAVIQATKREPRIMRYELTDFDWAAIKWFVPNKPRRHSLLKLGEPVRFNWNGKEKAMTAVRDRDDLWPGHHGAPSRSPRAP